jgi:Domain of unknown function (DUF4189)
MIDWKKPIASLALSALAVFSIYLFSFYSTSPASAQGVIIVCPEGSAPTGGPDVQACAPIPGFDPSIPSPAPSGPQWATRWGSIAIDAVLSRFGGSEGHSSKGRAEKAAVRQCKANGGGKSCKIIGAYYNQCGALAWGDSRAESYRAPTLEAAEQQALQFCGKYTTNCKIYYSGCSFSERVR